MIIADDFTLEARAMATFSQIEVESIADALGDTGLGLSGSEIGHLLATLKMPDPDPGMTKRRRLLNAFVVDQNSRGKRTGILEFIRRSMAPARWLRDRERYEPLRLRLNEALSLMGLEVDEKGELHKADVASTQPFGSTWNPDLGHFCAPAAACDPYPFF